MVFLSFVVLGVIMLLFLGSAVTPRSQKKPVWRWKLDDYGATLMRGVILLMDAGARNRWRMDNLHKQAGYSERGRMEGDRLPTDHAPHPREQMPPGAMPPHLRPPEGQPRYRPDDWHTGDDVPRAGGPRDPDPLDPEFRDDDPRHPGLRDDDPRGDDPRDEDNDHGAPRND